MTLEQLYQIRCQQPSTINEHLPTLRRYADDSEVVVELGVQGGISTTAFLVSKAPAVIGYDIAFDCRLFDLAQYFEPYETSALKCGMIRGTKLWIYIIENSLKANFTDCDLLFVDTHHTYLQLKEELHLHCDKVTKYILLHDTESFGAESEGWQDIPNAALEQKQGLTVAIEEFLQKHTEWSIKERFTNNNGLTVLERK